MLRYWPFASHVRETQFLTELREVLEVCDAGGVEALAPRLFRRVVKCLSDSHLQVADQALCLFENDSFVGVLRNCAEVAFPLVAPVVATLADSHWHA